MKKYFLSHNRAPGGSLQDTVRIWNTSKVVASATHRHRKSRPAPHRFVPASHRRQDQKTHAGREHVYVWASPRHTCLVGHPEPKQMRACGVRRSSATSRGFSAERFEKTNKIAHLLEMCAIARASRPNHPPDTNSNRVRRSKHFRQRIVAEYFRTEPGYRTLMSGAGPPAIWRILKISSMSIDISPASM
jgi:hypothetical protein